MPQESSRETGENKVALRKWDRTLHVLRKNGLGTKTEGWFARHWDESYEDRMMEWFVYCEATLVCLWPALLVFTYAAHDGQITYPFTHPLIVTLWAISTGLLLALPFCLYVVLNTVQWLTEEDRR